MCDCKNELNLCKLCVKKEKCEHLCAHRIDAREICSSSIESKFLNAQEVVCNNACASGVMVASRINAVDLNANTFCAKSGTINTLCVDNLSVSTPMNTLVTWRAAVTFAANNTYTLGGNINWDTILDDPNGNVALGPFTYTVPVSGYYITSFRLNSDSLAGTPVIAGIPTGLLSITSNGNPLIQSQTPFLSFVALQNATTTSLVLLNAGDIIQMNYNVLVLDPAVGLTNYVGTVSLKGNGRLPGESFFDIHYLSSLTQGPPPGACRVCPVVSVQCSPVTVSCNDCIPEMGKVCEGK